MKRILFIALIALTSCTKEDTAKYCWECADAAGNDIPAGGCNLTESQVQAQFDAGFFSVNGVDYRGKKVRDYCKKR